MSRNKENNALRTTQRANGSIISLTRTPQSEDFFTDSLLDASKIPTPSPKKQAFSAAYKGRRALGTTRTLKDAWNATAGNGRDLAYGDGAVAPRPLHVKPVPAQLERSHPSSANQVEGRNTPSPSRHSSAREQANLTSPISSPPHALADTYQRIADEEDLAAQEGESEEEYTGDFMADELSVTDTGDVLQGSLPPDTPALLRTTSEVTPHQLEAGSNKENCPDDEITSLSEASGLSFLKQITDQGLAAKLTPHTIDRAKDRQRLERALLNDRPIAFSHAYRSRPGLTTENLLRNASPSERLAGPDSSAGSIKTDRSEPAPNVPRVWGTKSKAGKEWLRSRRESGTNPLRSSPIPESSQVDWAAAAADIPLPNVDDSSTPRMRGSESSPPASLHKRTSLDKIRQWELNDFTGHSMQVSQSPPVRLRPQPHDHLRDREIETLEKQALTTNRLDEIQKKISKEALRQASRSSGAGPAQTPQVDDPAPLSTSKGVKFADEGEHIPDTPVIVYRSALTSSELDSESKSNQVHSDQSRQQSHDHLQRLAKVMSNSPRASPSPGEWSLIGSAEGTKGSDVNLSRPDQLPKRADVFRRSSKQVADVKSTPQGAKSADTAKTPVMTGAWTDTILPDTVKTVKRPDERIGHAQTPHVHAGGWVNTPLAGKRQSSALAPMTIEEVPEELTNGLTQIKQQDGPELGSSDQMIVLKASTAPKSALANLISRAKMRLVSQDATATKERNDTLNLGDATIESLEDLLTLDAADMTTLIRLGAESDSRDQILRSEDRMNPGNEAELLERLGSKLERLRTNIHDARKGISKLEHQVSHPSPYQISNASASQGPCEACGCHHASSSWSSASTQYTLPLTLAVPRLLQPVRKDLNHWLPRPTFVGWIVLVAWLWYISETTVCELYCHPLYAESYDWPSEPEPVFPWALPTMVGRWTRLKGVLGFAWRVCVAFVRVLGQAFGITDGFVEDAFYSAASPTAGVNFGQVQTRGSGPDLSMMVDEYI